MATRVYYVARAKSRAKKVLYATLGHETGMGRTIENRSLRLAKKSGSPAGLMYGFLGGHYEAYNAVKVTETVEYQEEVVDWPDSETVFDR